MGAWKITDFRDFGANKGLKKPRFTGGCGNLDCQKIKDELSKSLLFDSPLLAYFYTINWLSMSTNFYISLEYFEEILNIARI